MKQYEERYVLNNGTVVDRKCKKPVFLNDVYPVANQLNKRVIELEKTLKKRNKTIRNLRMKNDC